MPHLCGGAGARLHAGDRQVRYLGIPEASFIRFENALDTGQKITADFNSMLGKLVVHGADRLEAISRSIAALHELAVLGVRTNIDYLAKAFDHVAFRQGGLHTGFVDEHSAALAPGEADAALATPCSSPQRSAFADFRDVAFGVPEPHATIGRWRN